jgi:hypothetical protein
LGVNREVSLRFSPERYIAPCHEMRIIADLPEGIKGFRVGPIKGAPTPH